MRNKWKIAFWLCLLVLVVTTVIGVYSIVDQAVTLSYMKEGYKGTESDLETIIQIIGQTDQTKPEIETLLKHHKLYEYMDFKKDTIGMERVTLIFENDSLKSIKKQW